MFPELNLPAAHLNLDRDASGRTVVYDILRRRWIVLTPEEYVRQHFVHHLINNYGYSANRLANEVGIRLNGTLRRCDTVVYSDSLESVMIVEYKAPDIVVTQRVFDQIARYNMVLGTPFLAVSNGITTYCCRIINENGSRRAVFLKDIPPFAEIRGM